MEKEEYLQKRFDTLKSQYLEKVKRLKERDLMVIKEDEYCWREQANRDWEKLNKIPKSEI